MDKQSVEVLEGSINRILDMVQSSGPEASRLWGELVAKTQVYGIIEISISVAIIVAIPCLFAFMNRMYMAGDHEDNLPGFIIIAFFAFMMWLAAILALPSVVTKAMYPEGHLVGEILGGNHG